MQKMYLCYYFFQFPEKLILILAAFAGQLSLTTPCAPSWLCELRKYVKHKILFTWKGMSVFQVFSCHRDVLLQGYPHVEFGCSSTGEARLGKHSQKSDGKLLFFRVGWLFVGQEWEQRMSAGDGFQARADWRSGAAWCVSSWGKSRIGSAGPRQWHPLNLLLRSVVLNLILYIPTVTGQREWKEPLNPPLRVPKKKKKFKSFSWLILSRTRIESRVNFSF